MMATKPAAAKKATPVKKAAPAKKPAAKAAAKKPAAKPKAAKARKWSPDSTVPLCSARAVAQSLQIALGRAVSDEDVLALHWAAGGDREAGASILSVLEAAQEHGLAGYFPVAIRSGADLLKLAPAERPHLILGADLPEPHALLATSGGAWWSWGEPYDPEDFPGAVIDEAWAVTW